MLLSHITNTESYSGCRRSRKYCYLVLAVHTAARIAQHLTDLDRKAVPRHNVHHCVTTLHTQPQQYYYGYKTHPANATFPPRTKNNHWYICLHLSDHI